jgi:type VI secretion system protein ImpJ
MKYRLAPVHWKEGMFIQPHHFQAAHRGIAELDSELARNFPYGWGFSLLDVDTDALQGMRLKISRAALRLQNGTWINVPGNAELPEESFQEHLTNADRPISVWIGVRRAEPHQPRTYPLGEAHRGAIRPLIVREDTVEDENTGSDERTIQVRLWNVKLFFSPPNEDYESLKIGEITRSPQTKGPVFNATFVPPILNIGAAPSLVEKLRNIVIELNNQSASLQGSVENLQKIDNPQKMISGFFNLQVVSSFGPVLEMLCRTEEAHPAQVYLELARLAGALTPVSPEIIPKIPKYDHGNIGEAMDVLMGTILRMLKGGIAPEYIERPFEIDIERRDIRVCSIDQEWLMSEHAIYIGIDTEISEMRVDAILNDRRVKIGPPSKMKELTDRRIRGIRVMPENRVANVPIGLAHFGNRFYYQLEISKYQSLAQDLLNDLKLEIRGIPAEEIPNMKLYVHVKSEEAR